MDSTTDQDGDYFNCFGFLSTFIKSRAQSDDKGIPSLGEMLGYSHYSNNHGVGGRSCHGILHWLYSSQTNYIILVL